MKHITFETYYILIPKGLFIVKLVLTLSVILTFVKISFKTPHTTSGDLLFLASGHGNNKYLFNACKKSQHPQTSQTAEESKNNVQDAKFRVSYFVMVEAGQWKPSLTHIIIWGILGNALDTQYANFQQKISEDVSWGMYQTSRPPLII